MTVGEIYQATYQQLRTLHWDENEARGAARVLCDEATGTRYSHLAQPEKTIEGRALEQWQEQLAKLSRGLPLPYVLGRREFFGLEFICDERALIPRPETELLVEIAVQTLQNHPAPRLADLGTGSGAIAVSVAHTLPGAQVWATDVSPAALALARANAQKQGVAGRLHFVQGQTGQWAAPLQGEHFEVVLSNPPYIPRDDIETLQTSVRDFEPRSALGGGVDGLDCYRELAAQCSDILAPGGLVAFELGAGQFDQVRALFEQCGWQVGAPRLDMQNIARVLIARC